MITMGEFTFHSSQGSSVVDYVAVSTNNLDSVVDFQISDASQAISDHNTLSCEIRVGTHFPPQPRPKTTVTKCKWDNYFAKQFVSDLEHA